MAFNPYAISGSILQGLETEATRRTKQERADIAVKAKKQEMAMSFEAELEAKEKAAQEELRKKYKSKKGLGLLGTLVSLLPSKNLLAFFNPIAGAALSGVIAASEGKRAGKHALSQAQLAKKYAMDIDPRWKGTFLGRDASKYLRESEKGYGDIVRSAEDIKSETGGLGGMLKTGLMSGLSSFAIGKAMKGVGDKFGAAKYAKVAKRSVSNMLKAGMDPEMVEGALASGGYAISPGVSGGIEQLAAKEGVDPKLLEELMSAKMPGLKALFSGVGEAGKKFGEEEGILANTTTTLAGLLAMLEGIQQGTYRE